MATAFPSSRPSQQPSSTPSGQPSSTPSMHLLQSPSSRLSQQRYRPTHRWSHHLPHLSNPVVCRASFLPAIQHVNLLPIHLQCRPTTKVLLSQGPTMGPSVQPRCLPSSIPTQLSAWCPTVVLLAYHHRTSHIHIHLDVLIADPPHNPAAYPFCLQLCSHPDSHPPAHCS